MASCARYLLLVHGTIVALPGHLLSNLKVPTDSWGLDTLFLFNKHQFDPSGLQKILLILLLFLLLYVCSCMAFTVWVVTGFAE